MGLITKASFAKKHCFSRQYVDELLKQGELTEHDGFLDEEEADTVIENKRAINPNATKFKGGLQEQFLKAKLNNELERGKQLKLETAEKEQSLISVNSVRDTLFRRGRVIRDAMLNIPDRVSAILATMSDAREIHAMLTKEIRAVLEELSRNV